MMTCPTCGDLYAVHDGVYYYCASGHVWRMDEFPWVVRSPTSTKIAESEETP